MTTKKPGSTFPLQPRMLKVNPSQWSTALATSYRATRASNLWELILKVNLRWYITPAQIHKYALSVAPSCWRNCGEPGNLLHFLWGCNKILKFWVEVFGLIRKVTKTPTVPSPELALLNIGIENFPPHLRYATTHILLAARLTITRHWKFADLILVDEVISLAHTQTLFGAYERMFAALVGGLAATTMVWLPWLEWFQDDLCNTA